MFVIDLIAAFGLVSLIFGGIARLWRGVPTTGHVRDAIREASSDRKH